MFSIGGLVVLLTCLQLAGALALQRRVAWRGWAMFFLLAILVWTIARPGQLAVGRAVPLIVVLPIYVLGVILVLGVVPLIHRGAARRGAGRRGRWAGRARGLAT